MATTPAEQSANSHKKDFSIDLSLELEHQLNAEVDSETQDSVDEQLDGKDTLDPHILVNISPFDKFCFLTRNFRPTSFLSFGFLYQK
jgi:hypothetical protein